MKYLGIDYGEKRIGLAVSDNEGRIAFPKEVLENSHDLVEKIWKVIESEQVEKVVVGDSKDYNFKDNPIMEQIKAFISDLKSKKDIEVDLHPEFMSSMQAIKEFPGKSDKVDASAAAIILQSYLDSR